MEIFSWVAEYPLIGSTRMPQNVLVFEVREAAGRSRLKERKSKKAKKSLSRERRELSAGSPGQARVPFRVDQWERSENNRLFREISAQESLACLSFPTKTL